MWVIGDVTGSELRDNIAGGENGMAEDLNEKEDEACLVAYWVARLCD